MGTGLSAFVPRIRQAPGFLPMTAGDWLNRFAASWFQRWRAICPGLEHHRLGEPEMSLGAPPKVSAAAAAVAAVVAVVAVNED